MQVTNKYVKLNIKEIEAFKLVEKRAMIGIVLVRVKCF